MFSKQKKSVPWLVIYDGSGNAMKKIRLSELLVPDDIIIEKSIEFFRDPSPCVIHRTAVLSRLMMELEKALCAGGITPLGSLPADLMHYLSGYKDAHSILISQEEKE
jgi:hypothetical protein